MPVTTSLPKLSYTQVGHRGPHVLLIMGFGMRGEVWKPQVEGLGGECQVVYYDARGIGESDPVGDSLSMTDMAHDAQRVLDAVGWKDKVHLVGVSMGGMVAQELALLEPDRFASLSLLATHAGGRAAWLPPVSGIWNFLAMRIGPPKQRARAFARLLYPRSYLRTAADHDAFRKRMKLQMGHQPHPLTLRRQLAAIRRHDTRARLPKVEIPTLIVKPELDILVSPAHSDRIKQGIKHAAMMSLPNVGHGLIFQSADQINTRLLEHFRKSEA